VNIIREFRDGTLQLSSDLVDYADGLRRVAVDLKSRSTNATGTRACLERHARLVRGGVSEHEVEGWLDVCQRLAYADEPTEQFVQAALEFARLSTEDGVGYAQVIEDYRAKTQISSELDDELERKRAGLLECESRLREMHTDLRAVTRHLPRVVY